MGSARAAASDTAPRRPAQLTTKVSRVASRGSRRAITRRGEFGRRLAAKTHSSRVPTTTAATRSDDTQQLPGDRPARPARMLGQLEADEHEDEAVEDEADHLPGAQPQDPAARGEDRPQPATDHQAAVTAARTPDRPQPVGRQVGGERDDQGDRDLDRRVVETREEPPAPRPTMNPSAMPPTAATTNPTRASERTKLPVTTASTAARYATSAVASLKRDSPSMRVTTTRGAPSRRKTQVAASASVGATIAPSANAPPQPRSGTIACATTATIPS